MTNHATVNELCDDKALIRKYQAEIAQLRRTLAAGAGAGEVGPGIYYSPCHRFPYISRIEGSNCFG